MGSLAVRLTGTVTSHSNAWLDYTESNIDTTSNTSTVTFKMYLKSDGGGSTWRGQPRTLYFSVAGGQYAYPVTFDTRKDHTELLFTHTQTFTHAPDGTFATPISISFETGLNGVSGMYLAETWIELTQIPRKSTATLSKTSLNILEELVINIQRASSAFTHKVYIKCGSKTYDIQAYNSSNVTVKYTIPDGMATNFPKATSGSATVYIGTYSGSTLLGEVSYPITVSIPDKPAYYPKITAFTSTRIDGAVPVAWNVYVKTKSKVKLAVTASGVLGSTIKAYSIKGPDLSSTSSSVTTGFLNKVGTNTYTAVVTDTRGRSVTSTVSISVVDYAAPTISTASATRCAADGTPDEEGTYAKLLFAGTTASVAGYNASSRTYRWRIAGGEWSTAYTVTDNTEVKIGGDFSADHVYEFKYTVADSFTSVSKTVSINTSYSLMDFLKGGKGIAFGKAATEEGFDVALPAKFSDSLTVGGIHLGAGRGYIYPDGDTGRVYFRTRDVVNGTSYRYYAFTNEGLNLFGNNIVGANNVSASQVTATKLIASQVSTDPMTDYIVSKGTSGKWYYWKWASGLALCIHNGVTPGNFVGVAWGSVYDSGDMAWTFSDYPFTFVDIPYSYPARTTADTSNQNSYYAMISMNGGTKSTPPKFMLVRGTPPSEIIGHPYMTLVTIGRWK